MINDSYILNGVTIPNRAVFQPMECCDCNDDGSPSELTIQKYIKAAESGVGIVWFEANAVCPEGRTNPRQLMLTRGSLIVLGIGQHANTPKLLVQILHEVGNTGADGTEIKLTLLANISVRVARRRGLGDVKRLFDVECPRFAVSTESAIVGNTVGCVGVLLNFRNKYSRADSVQSACRNKENVSLFNGYIVYYIIESIGFNSLFKFSLIEFSVKTVSKA